MVLFSSTAIDSFATLLEAVKKTPSFGSWGMASAAHLNGLIFLEAVGSSTNIHVPYKDYGVWFADTANQHVTFGFATVGSTIGLEKAGKLKYHGITENLHLTNVPTVKSLLKNNAVFVKPYSALSVKTSMPIDIKQQYIKDISIIMSSKQIKDTLSALNYNSNNPSPAEFNSMLSKQSQIVLDLIAKYNIQLSN
jgi:tripartite-type tricarboxylate transporter receptor subunit TctC